MAPSAVDLTHKFTCCVCEESLETVSSLHYHQMCYHTTEELSLALLTLKGLKLLVGNREDSDSEDAMLRTGLAKYPHFLLNQNSSQVDSDSESTETAEGSPAQSSRLQGAILTLSGESIAVPLVKISHQTDASGKYSLRNSSSDELLENKVSDINMTPLKSGRKQKTKLSVRGKRKGPSIPKETASPKTRNNFRRKQFVISNEKSLGNCVELNQGNLILSWNSDDSKTVTNKVGDNSETDTELKKRPVSELSYSVNDRFSAIFIKSDIETIGSSEAHNVTFDMQCNDETGSVLTSAPEQCKTETYSPLHKVSSCSSPSSVDSFLSPDNSPHPERCIKAIISRLPNIVIPDTDQNSNIKSQGRRTSRKKQRTPRKYVNDSYVLPSPISNHHRSCVSYDYGNKQSNDNCSQANVQFQDYFVPNVALESGVDAECGTASLEISEKEVQTIVVTPSDNDSGIQIEERENKCKKDLVDECINKETQTGLLSITTRRLAAYRKQPSRKRLKEQPCGKKLDTDGSASTTQERKVIPTNNVFTAGTSETRVFPSPSLHFSKNISIPGKDVLENSEKMRPETEGEMTAWCKSLMKIYPRGTTDRRFFCEPCGKGYKKKSHLERHVRVHTGERPFQCSHCEKRFAVRSILKQHLRTHTGEKPYCCNICQQRFPQKSGLMTHTMLHTGKPFKCDRCDKAFVSNHKLVQHLKSHGGSRKYVCPTCSTEFFTEGALLQHKQSHNRKNSHLCMICGEGFQKETFLKQHLDQHLQKFNKIDMPV